MTSTHSRLNLTDPGRSDNACYTQNPAMPRERVTYKRLCRAAGGQHPGELRFCVESGWNASDIDAFTSGKSALHMAAWTGCLANVRYLIEDVGCDPNAHSIAKNSYGKTAVFFAAARCRADVVEYLLDACPDLKVNIVNSKGQSVMSICSSHDIPDAVLEKIRRRSAREEEESGGPSSWWDFREHWDGLEYCDLEPRFLVRELRETDVVTEHAINPTTRESRRRSFAGSNPGVAVAREYGMKGRRSRRRPEKRQPISVEEAMRSIRRHEFWDHVSESNGVGNEEVALSLVDLVEHSDQFKCAWIPFLSNQLVICFEGNNKRAAVFIGQIMRAVAGEKRRTDNANASHSRINNLLEKILLKVDGGSCSEQLGDVVAPSRKATRRARFLPSLDPWKVELQKFAWRELSMSLFEDITRMAPAGAGSHRLALPQPPSFISSLEQLSNMLIVIQHCSILSIDTEWHGHNNNTVSISTIQVSAVVPLDSPDKNRGDATVKTYVVDLMNCQDYGSQVKEWIRDIIEKEDVLILGFAIGNDLSRIEAYLHDCENAQALCCRSILDLQRVFCLSGSEARSGILLPGLKACVSRFTDVPLSKDEQCSNWSRRPLTASQLDYAGMDAAVLLALLAEHLRACEGTYNWV